VTFAMLSKWIVQKLPSKRRGSRKHKVHFANYKILYVTLKILDQNTSILTTNILFLDWLECFHQTHHALIKRLKKIKKRKKKKKREQERAGETMTLVI
jgi:GTP-binding protein EngB required for normal cell division